MGVENSCGDLARELAQRKAIVQAYVRRAEGLPSGNPKKHETFADELKRAAKDIAAEIDRLQRECPGDWQAKSRQLDLRFSELKEKMDGALSRPPSETFIG
jgi:hypothetical protein